MSRSEWISDPELVKPTVKRAYELIRDAQNWTQHAEARTATGKPCSPFSSRAICFCAWGALLRAARETLGPDVTKRKVEKLAYGGVINITSWDWGCPGTLIRFNDGKDGRVRIMQFFEHSPDRIK